MSPTQVLELTASMRRCAEQGRALPAECYTDRELFDREIEQVLRPGWHAVARWDELPNPGDFASLDLLGEPLLLVRDDAGELRVFSRVCLHRAHTIVEGSGHAKRFVCPYHRWSYERDGTLATAPLMDAEPDFDRGPDRRLVRDADRSGRSLPPAGAHPGLTSRLWQPGRLSGYERALTRFHTYLADRLEGQASGPASD